MRIYQRTLHGKLALVLFASAGIATLGCRVAEAPDDEVPAVNQEQGSGDARGAARDQVPGVESPESPTTRGTAGFALGNVNELVSQLRPTADGSVAGVVRFQAVDDGVALMATLEGLAPGSRHGLHIHQYGDCTAVDASSAGAHLDPQGNPHDLPPETPRHAGDLGNIVADDEGRVAARIVVRNVSIAGPLNPILGRAVIVHATADEGTQPSGDAGPRLACGVIGVACSPGSGDSCQ